MENISESQKFFYLSKFKKFGDSPLSVSWNDKKSQYLRFQDISELFKYEKDKSFSVHEIGCGLAHYKEFLDSLNFNVAYSGSDIVQEFIDCDREKYPNCEFFLQNISEDFENINPSIKNIDYFILSGTFNPKEDNLLEEWELFIFKSIENMFKMAEKGICFNFLTTYSDYYNNKLYYADPGKIMDWCVRNLSRFVSIKHETPLYEFTVYVYKEKFLKEQFSDYPKYFKDKL